MWWNQQIFNIYQDLFHEENIFWLGLENAMYIATTFLATLASVTIFYWRNKIWFSGFTWLLKTQGSQKSSYYCPDLTLRWSFTVFRNTTFKGQMWLHKILREKTLRLSFAASHAHRLVSPGPVQKLISMGQIFWFTVWKCNYLTKMIHTWRYFYDANFRNIWKDYCRDHSTQPIG